MVVRLLSKPSPHVPTEARQACCPTTTASAGRHLAALGAVQSEVRQSHSPGSPMRIETCRTPAARRCAAPLAISLIVVLLASATPQATTCANPTPSGQVVTPSCTWIVQQWDPGVWLDNLGQFWVWVTRLLDAGAIAKYPVTVPAPPR